MAGFFSLLDEGKLNPGTSPAPIPGVPGSVPKKTRVSGEVDIESTLHSIFQEQDREKESPGGFFSSMGSGKVAAPPPPKGFIDTTLDIAGKAAATPVGKATSRALGVTIGILDAPRAFIQGAEAADVKDTGSFVGNLLETPANVGRRVRAGVESAKKAAFEEGSFGVTYDDAHKKAHGATVSEKWHKKFGVDQSSLEPGEVFKGSIASIAAFLEDLVGNVVRDPLLGGAAATKMVKSRMLPGALVKSMMPDERVAAQNALDFLDYLEEPGRKAFLEAEDILAEVQSTLRSVQGRQAMDQAKKQIAFAKRVEEKVEKSKPTYDQLVADIASKEEITTGALAGSLDATKKSEAAQRSFGANVDMMAGAERTPRGTMGDLLTDLGDQSTLRGGTEAGYQGQATFGANVEQLQKGTYWDLIERLRQQEAAEVAAATGVPVKNVVRTKSKTAPTAEEVIKKAGKDKKSPQTSQPGVAAEKLPPQAAAPTNTPTNTPTKKGKVVIREKSPAEVVQAAIPAPARRAVDPGKKAPVPRTKVQDPPPPPQTEAQKTSAVETGEAFKREMDRVGAEIRENTARYAAAEKAGDTALMTQIGAVIDDLSNQHAVIAKRWNDVRVRVVEPVVPVSAKPVPELDKIAKRLKRLDGDLKKAELAGKDTGPITRAIEALTLRRDKLITRAARQVEGAVKPVKAQPPVPASSKPKRVGKQKEPTVTKLPYYEPPNAGKKYPYERPVRPEGPQLTPEEQKLLKDLGLWDDAAAMTEEVAPVVKAPIGPVETAIGTRKGNVVVRKAKPSLEREMLREEGIAKESQKATSSLINEKVDFSKVSKANATTKLLAATAVGFDIDENGELTFRDPQEIAIGMAAVATGMRLKLKHSNGFYSKALQTSKNIQKLEGMLATEAPWYKDISWIGWLNEKIFNRVAALKPYKQTYEMALTHSSYKDVAWMKMRELQDIFKPIRKVKEAEKVVSRYVLAKRALTRAKRNISNPNAFNDINMIDDTIAELEDIWLRNGGNLDDLNRTMTGLQDWTRKYILDEAVEAGFLSKEMRDKIVADNDFYAAFRIVERLPAKAKETPYMPAGEYFSVPNNKIVRAMTGTVRGTSDPLEATIGKFMEAQSAFARNRVASSLIDSGLVPGMKRVARTKEEFGFLAAERKKAIAAGKEVPYGVIEKDLMPRTGVETIARFKNGHAELYMVPEEIGRAMKTLQPRQMNRVLTYTANLFRNSATTWYLPFTVTNMFRDSMLAFATSPVYRAQDIIKYPLDWAKGAYHGVKWEFLGADDLVEQYLKSGGGFGFSGEVKNAKIAKDYLFKHGIEIANPMTYLKMVEKVTGSIELAPRLAVYQRAMAKGASSREAALLARAATIDFSKGGQAVKVLNQLVPFVNARFQAVNVVKNALMRDTKNTMIKAITTTAVPAVGVYAWNRVHYGELYDDIPGYIKENNIVFIHGSTVDDKGRVVPKYFCIPKSEMAQLVMNPIEYAFDREFEKDERHIGKFMVDWLSDISPLPFMRDGELALEKFAGSAMPPLVKGFYELGTGRSTFTGRDIISKKMQLSGTPPELQFDERTSFIYKEIGRKFGMSPLVMRNFMQNLFAGYGREGLDPMAMFNGLSGRMHKSIGGEKESRAWKEIAELKRGYDTMRAFVREAMESGYEDRAEMMIEAWNEGVMEKIDGLMKIDPSFEDEGRLERMFTFSERKELNMEMDIEEEEDLEENPESALMRLLTKQ